MRKISFRNFNCDNKLSFTDLCENKNNFDNEANDLSCKTLKHKAIWLFGATQKEFDLKFKILNTELERAEFQKQTAFNEWKTAEIKRKLAEGQIQEYNRHEYFLINFIK